MRCILSAICFCLLPALLAAQEVEERFRAWELHEISELPRLFQVDKFDVDINYFTNKSSFLGADFSGLFASRYGQRPPYDARRPVAVFNFRTGETRHPLAGIENVDAYVAGQGVQGSRVLMFGTAGPEGEEVPQSWLYDWDTDALTTIPADIVPGFDIVQADTLTPSGQIVLGAHAFGDAISFEHRSLILWDPVANQEVARLDPPWEAEKIPGFPQTLSPGGLLMAYSASDSGWVTGFPKIIDDEIRDQVDDVPRYGLSGFFANFHSGEFYLTSFPGSDVDEQGRGTGFNQGAERGGIFSDGEVQSFFYNYIPSVGSARVWGPQIAPNGQQIFGAAAVDDEGRVLALVTDYGVNQPYRVAIGLPLHIVGDYNGNGRVEQGDLDLILLNWNTDARPDGWVHDLASYSGRIDQAELDQVLLNWDSRDGEPVVGLPDWMTTLAASVPEPATWILAILLAVPCLAIVRRRIRIASFGKTRRQ